MRQPGDLHRAISHLLEEHRAAERVLDILSNALAHRDLDRVEEALAFLEYVVDRVHHAKEEDVLFTKLLEVAADVEPAVIETLHRQHTHGRSYLRAAKALIDDVRDGSEEAMHALVETMQAYRRYSNTHMKQEERVIFPLAADLLADEENGGVLEHFERLQNLLIESDQYDAFMAFSKEQDARTVVLKAPPVRPISKSPRPSPPPVRTLYEDHRHRVVQLVSEADRRNAFVIVDGGRAILVDPGAPQDYARTSEGVRDVVGEGRLELIFLSQQDAHMGSALNRWLMDTNADALVSALWSPMVSEHGLDAVFASRMRPVPDVGGIITLGAADIALLPAHFLSSAGGLQMFDPRSKVLFSGALGASAVPASCVVEDFDAHVPHLLERHRRHMGGRTVVQAWVRMIEQLDVRTIAPHRGAPLQGEAVIARFLEWCRDTPCGPDVMTPCFALPTRSIR